MSNPLQIKRAVTAACAVGNLVTGKEKASDKSASALRQLAYSFASRASALRATGIPKREGLQH